MAMSKMLIALMPHLCAVLSLLPIDSIGQIFLPDTNERAMLNAVIPGIVDANGIMDTLHPGIATLDTTILSTGGPMEEVTSLNLNGLRYLDSLDRLSIGINGVSDQFELHIDGLPQKLRSLTVLSLYGGSLDLGDLPVHLERLTVQGDAFIESVLVIGTMPDSLHNMYLNSLASVQWVGSTMIGSANVENWLSDAMLFPTATIQTLLINSTYLSTLDLSSTTITSLTFNSAQIPGIVQWPIDLNSLSLSMMGSLLIEQLPPSITELSIADSGPVCLPWLPDGLNSLFLTQPTCLPNWPEALPFCIMNWTDMYPEDVVYCSVLNTTCPGANPGISGHILMDVNLNGECDPGEPPLPQASVTLLPNGNVTGCDGNGYWEIGVLPGTYTITPSSTYPYFQSISPTEHTADLPNMGDADTLNDFAVTLIPDMEDLRAYCHAEPARPGFDNRLYLTCQNYGTVPMDAQLTLEYDADQTWVGSSVPPTTQSGTTAIWDLGTLAIGASQLITVDLNTATTVALGTPINCTLSASPTSGDETPSDNIVVITDSVVGSYDPNDKLLSPASMSPEQVQSGTKVITYTIRFQNTGTYLAERVVIVDTLPEGLQPQSVEFLSSSHPCRWYVLDGVLHFIHEGIDLPDSTSDEPGSHGYVQFRILPDADLTDGETVMNIAHIVFDFNEPIITPPAVFSVDIETAIEVIAGNTLMLYPNPVQERLWFSQPSAVDGAVAYAVRDLLGQDVRTGRVNGTTSIDVSGLAPGAYMLLAGGASGRFVKH